MTASALAADLAARLGDPAIHRIVLAGRAQGEAEAGRVELALEHIREAAGIEVEQPQPWGDLAVAASHSYILLVTCQGADEVAAAGRRSLETAARWGIDNYLAAVVLANISEALRRAGRVGEAAELIDPVSEGQPVPHRAPVYSERGQLDLLRGRCDEATALLEAVAELFVGELVNRVQGAQDLPTAELWCGRPQQAYERLAAALRDVVAVDHPGADVAGLLVLAARAAADLTDPPTAAPAVPAGLLAELEELRARMAVDPFGPSTFVAARPALHAAWAAETARLSGAPSLDLCAAAAARFDRIGRPHDAAYHRWRGAELALATGQATLATRLLRRAERDAHEHVPLVTAIRATVRAGSRA